MRYKDILAGLVQDILAGTWRHIDAAVVWTMADDAAMTGAAQPDADFPYPPLLTIAQTLLGPPPRRGS